MESEMFFIINIYSCIQCILKAWSNHFQRVVHELIFHRLLSHRWSIIISCKQSIIMSIFVKETFYKFSIIILKLLYLLKNNRFFSIILVFNFNSSLNFGFKLMIRLIIMGICLALIMLLFLNSFSLVFAIYRILWNRDCAPYASYFPSTIINIQNLPIHQLQQQFSIILRYLSAFSKFTPIIFYSTKQK